MTDSGSRFAAGEALIFAPGDTRVTGGDVTGTAGMTWAETNLRVILRIGWPGKVTGQRKGYTQRAGRRPPGGGMPHPLRFSKVHVPRFYQSSAVRGELLRAISRALIAVRFRPAPRRELHDL